MTSRKAICFFLCTTVLFQQQYCSPVPTNRKIRHDTRRNSFSDQSEENSLTSNSSTTDQTESTSSVQVSSTEVTTVGSETTLSTSTSEPCTTRETKLLEIVIKLSDIFKQSDLVQGTNHSKVKRDAALDNLVNVDGKRSFKPAQNQEELLEVAEVHLFKPYFKYKSATKTRIGTGSTGVTKVSQ
ncbi:uncharacterized protein LOC129719661 [Wyeomyia smithii]|uniref:uncharacterized protein LOC129719661 n=1 Tax=Wyeomyia smithii TaxID=174621 RepID=UPI002467F6ED|nr:uncharacterized protein LOC129719661 [Wyeomyia smithii]